MNDQKIVVIKFNKLLSQLTDLRQKTLQTISSYPPPLPLFSTLCFVFVVAVRVFAIEQFWIRRWKANEKTNLMVSKYLKIGRLQPEKLRNMFEQIQKMKKSRVCAVYSTYTLHSNPNTLLLISRSPAGKNQKLFLTQLSL